MEYLGKIIDFDGWYGLNIAKVSLYHAYDDTYDVIDQNTGTYKVLSTEQLDTVMRWLEAFDLRVKCECGSDTVKHPGHMWYCPKFKP